MAKVNQKLLQEDLHGWLVVIIYGRVLMYKHACSWYIFIVTVFAEGKWIMFRNWIEHRLLKREPDKK